MDCLRIQRLNLAEIPSPSFIVDQATLEGNLKTLDKVQRQSGCKILLALKAFAMFSLFPLINKYLAGVCASGYFEARLGKEEFGKQVHSYGPAYSRNELEKILVYSDYIIFNSERQWQSFRPIIPPGIHCGLRINPGYSEIDIDLYNPCATNSRLGIPKEFFPEDLDGISGIHFHAMCEQNSDTLERIWNVVESQYDTILPKLDWINLGGGHHITQDGYDLAKLVRLIKKIKQKYSLDVYLEPGEAVVLNAGFLVSSVLDITRNDTRIAILDTSAETHMPDVLAMPYRPEIIGAGKPDEFEHSYRLAGVTCLAGDIIGDYSFPRELRVGDRIIFTDMAHYSMVKTTMFNGINLPGIAIINKTGKLEMIKRFTYEDYKDRLS